MIAATAQMTPNNPTSNGAAHAMQDRLCPGCKQSAVTEDGGLVVAFGQSFFHVDCFKCAKCGNQVTADTNILLLSDGSPVCANCSYSCSVCHEPILDEAIMTGEDSYHAQCFKCKVCNKRIEELVFARTSQGIYCMDCHNERMIKIRRHAQKKAEKERNGGSASSRDRAAREFHRENGRASPANPRTSDRPGSSRSHTSGRKNLHLDLSRPSSSRGADRPIVRSPKREYVEDAFDPSMSTSNSPRPGATVPSPTSPGIAITSSLGCNSLKARDTQGPVASPDDFASRPPPNKNNTLPIPPLSNGDKSLRRKSYDDGVRPLDILFRQNAAGSPEGHDKQPVTTVAEGAGLNLPTSRRDKRRSINPGLVLGDVTKLPEMSSGSSTTLLSPISGVFSGTSSKHPNSPPGRESPQEQWRDASSQFSRPSSTTDSREAGSSEGPLRPARSSFASSLNVRSSRSNSRSRPNSPAHQADVPHNIESDTDAENGEVEFPPALPPKENPGPAAPSAESQHSERGSFEADSTLYNDSEEDLSDASPTQTHHTYIAPALPPIRFSLPADFSDLLFPLPADVSDRLNAAKAADTLKSVPEHNEVPTTPPPTAVSLASNGTSNSSGAGTIVASPAVSSSEFGTKKGDLRGKKHRNPSPTFANGEINDAGLTSNIYQRRSSSDTFGPSVDSSDSLKSPMITVTESEPSPSVNSQSNPDALVCRRLREVIEDAQQRGVQQLKLEKQFVETILSALESKRDECSEMKSRLDGMKRESRQYMDGISVASSEYDKELKARRAAEAEVTRLKVQLSGQAASLNAMLEEKGRQQLLQKMTKELHDNLAGLEQNVSKLRVERDMTLAEVEELSNSKGASAANAEAPPANLGRSLTKRLDNIKSQYKHELIPLKEQKEALVREIAELKAAREACLEETTVLSARYEEIAELTNQYARRMDSLPETPAKNPVLVAPTRPRGSSMDRGQPVPPPIAHSISLPANSALHNDGTLKVQKPDAVDMPTPGKKFKWPGVKAQIVGVMSGARGKAKSEHAFQQMSILRFTRCDHCGDKMWGSQLRCSGCNISVHVRCHNHVLASCSQQNSQHREPDVVEPLGPSMFGRDLTEQVQADRQGGYRQVPVIVEKCIAAVDALALDYEGIYRKTGGSSHTKNITQLFERGDYSSFDLTDSERFNDICSVTSVLKTYFRMLPIPLLTFDLHDSFMSAIQLREASAKNIALLELINKLPDEHYHTLRVLVLHLHRVYQHKETNLMSARNLGVVFGPTLLRSPDPSAEFSDMAGKALFIEWIVENATFVFEEDDS
ncbi:RhoGAP-domain-containing protein [Pleurotus eryngii]|uniref:RhoGAP-domain-containing protein n=1 Tax=Pleurotus eryngii TaxID=5323 RepID=A0A9P6A9X3_PLEER|nr:RhoGAP-domain-containing protein [Pleurotus eryngii]